MIDLTVLEQFIAFAESGTLTQAAQELNISQPTLTRAMKVLEDDFQVKLFKRTKNKLTLNENGELALKYARKIINDCENMIESVRQHDRASRTISVGSCAPAPLWFIIPMLSNLYPQMRITSELKEPEELLADLKDGIFQIIVLQEEISLPELKRIPICEENLFFSLPKTHPLASKKELSFSDMNGETFLIYSNIGFWYDLTKKEMPDSSLLTQNDWLIFRELINSSSIAGFSTDRALEHEDSSLQNNRINIPVKDESAHVRYFCYCLKENSDLITPFSSLNKNL